MLIVRHPFVRLISSWNEKYSREHKHAKHYYKTSKGLIGHYDHDNWDGLHMKSLVVYERTLKATQGHSRSLTTGDHPRRSMIISDVRLMGGHSKNSPTID